MYRVYCDSWFWCQVQMPPARSAPLPNPNLQLCQYHRFSRTCLSRGGRVTAISPPMVTFRRILQDICYSMMQDTTYMFLCFLLCFLDCLLAFWSRTVRNGGASVCGDGAVVLRATTRPAVVQSAQERPLPLWRYSVGRCARGWDSNINHPLMNKFLLSA